jgi:hypothetical protein
MFSNLLKNFELKPRWPPPFARQGLEHEQAVVARAGQVAVGRPVVALANLEPPPVPKAVRRGHPNLIWKLFSIA